MALLAISPFLIIFALILILKRPLWQAGSLTFGYTLFIVLTFWNIDGATVSQSLIRGLSVTLEIILLLVGALLIVEYLKASKGIDSLQKLATSLHSDIRYQAIILAWFLSAIIEGVAGFGTPGLIVAPLLIAIGLKPFTAISVALLGNTISVVFGALGLPISKGVAEGLSPEALGSISMEQLAVNVSMVHLFLAWLIPVAIVYLITKDNKLKGSNQAYAFAAFSGIIFSAISTLTVVFIGYEYASILGGLIGGAICILFLKPRFRDINHSLILPVLAPVILLFLSKSLNLSFDIFGINALASPGVFLLMTGGVLILLSRRGRGSAQPVKFPYVKLLASTITILSVVLTSQLIVSTSTSSSEPSIPSYFAQMMMVAKSDAEYAGVPQASMLSGLGGAAVTGSATVSNLLLSEVQSEVAILAGLPLILLLTTQLLGAALGNAISITNIAALEAVVKEKINPEKLILRNLSMVIIYGLIATVVAFSLG